MTERPKHPYDQALQPPPTEVLYGGHADLVRFWVLRHIVAIQAEVVLLETSSSSDELLNRRMATYVARLREVIALLDKPL